MDIDTHLKQNKQFDTIVIGAGFIGLTVSYLLSQYGIKSLIIDKQDLKLTTTLSYDGRTIALSHATSKLYQQIGLWDKMRSYVEPIKKIKVQDSKLGQDPSKLSLFFDVDHIEDAGDDIAMGYIIENHVFRQALLEACVQDKNITLLAPASVQSLHTTEEKAVVEIDNHGFFESKLLIGADGRFSFARKLMDIACQKETYAQSAIVSIIEHEKSHENIAYENFMSSGPFAILPMKDHPETGKHRSSIVWTDDTDKVQHFMHLPYERFQDQIAMRFGDFLGKVHSSEQRWSYPLTLIQAEKYTKERFCLLGDAAHAIHPIAGQGFNLGIRDVASLVELIVEQQKLGLDIGSEAVLSQYETWRKRDCQLMIFMTHSLNQFFSNNSPLLRGVRRIGLSLVNRMPPVKNFFMRYAMGQVGISTHGKLPKLLRGKNL